MPSFRRRASAVDADRVDEPTRAADTTADRERTLALAQEAEAEAAEAEAIASAARARARAIRLRREAAEAESEAEPADLPGDTKAAGDDVTTDVTPATAEADETAVAVDTTDADEAVDADDAHDTATVDLDDAPADEESVKNRRRLPWKGIAAAVVILGICALIAASGYMVWQHRQVRAEQERRADFAAAARQGVVTLMSLDFNHVKDDVQRIVDNTTGDFKKDFEGSVEDFTTMAQKSKVVTEATVNATAVESMSDSDNKATVLVAVTSRVTNTAGSNQEPRPWRLAVNLVREGDQIKMSKVEFVP